MAPPPPARLQIVVRMTERPSVSLTPCPQMEKTATALRKGHEARRTRRAGRERPRGAAGRLLPPRSSPGLSRSPSSPNSLPRSQFPESLEGASPSPGRGRSPDQRRRDGLRLRPTAAGPPPGRPPRKPRAQTATPARAPAPSAPATSLRHSCFLELIVDVYLQPASSITPGNWLGDQDVASRSPDR